MACYSYFNSQTEYRYVIDCTGTYQSNGESYLWILCKSLCPLVCTPAGTMWQLCMF